MSFDMIACGIWLVMIIWVLYEFTTAPLYDDDGNPYTKDKKN